MDAKVKQMWVDALRSGEYCQGTGELRGGNRFCCLGVLCDLHAKTTGKGSWDGEIYEAGKSRDGMQLPPAVRRWSGVRSAQGSLWMGKYNLAEINDEGGDFDLIAAIIEHEL